MFTVESLKRGEFIQEDKKRIRKLIKKLDDQILSVSTPLNGLPKGVGTDSTTKLIAEKVDLERELERLETEHEQVNEKIRDDISNVEQYYREILTEKYIDLKTWNEIGIKRYQSGDTIRKQITRFLKNQVNL